MNTEYCYFCQYIYFKKIAEGSKTSIWECKNNKSSAVLGRVKWYGPWRQYCFFPEPFADLVFNKGCLEDICRFIKEMTDLKNDKDKANKKFV